MEGFVDLQVNGYLGVDFSAPGLRLEGVRRVAGELHRRGTACFCPTMVSSPLEVYRANLGVLADACADAQLGPRLLGIHLEGPFLSPRAGARGAHARALIRPPSVELLQRLLDWARGRVALLTLAPDRPGAEEVIRFAAGRRIAVALGHHLADGPAIERAWRAGARACTHLGNGIPNLLPRHPNPIWEQLAHDGLAAMVIADGHHLPASFLKVVHRVKGSANTILASDSAPAAGMPPGRYSALGQQVILEENGRLWNPAGGHLVGSSACLAECVERARTILGLSPEDVKKMAHDNPLRLIGGRRAGRP